mmetsp:Transcript_88315/g.184554  ORF Transcript_88315/g.184554 Transcript_88315/m.184554 type:complete len:213 (-) Transcript_88315:1059-1697(-)
MAGCRCSDTVAPIVVTTTTIAALAVAISIHVVGVIVAQTVLTTALILRSICDAFLFRFAFLLRFAPPLAAAFAATAATAATASQVLSPPALSVTLITSAHSFVRLPCRRSVASERSDVHIGQRNRRQRGGCPLAQVLRLLVEGVSLHEALQTIHHRLHLLLQVRDGYLPRVESRQCSRRCIQSDARQQLLQRRPHQLQPQGVHRQVRAEQAV